mgnify:CR=1 FL=1
MEALSALLTRASVPAKKMTDPGPDDATIDTLLRAAVTAPDHGGLRPWRFILIRGAARRAFGELMADAYALRHADADPEMIQRQRDKPLRSPALLVVAARLSADNPKVPEIEQLLSAGAAIQNILIAAHALGWGAVWYTGDAAYDWNVAEPLGLGMDERIVGFIYLGTPPATRPAKERPDPSEFLREWSGPQERTTDSEI